MLSCFLLSTVCPSPKRVLLCVDIVLSGPAREKGGWLSGDDRGMHDAGRGILIIYVFGRGGCCWEHIFANALQSLLLCSSHNGVLHARHHNVFHFCAIQILSTGVSCQVPLARHWTHTRTRTHTRAFYVLARHKIRLNPPPAGAFYFVRTLVQYIERPEVNANMYNEDRLPNQGIGWIISTMFFVDSIMVRFVGVRTLV